MDAIKRGIDALRTFPLTAPVVAAVDTVVATARRKWLYVVSEPLVALGALFAVLQATQVADVGWKGYAAAYLVAAARWFTEPAIDVR